MSWIILWLSMAPSPSCWHTSEEGEGGEGRGKGELSLGDMFNLKVGSRVLGTWRNLQVGREGMSERGREERKEREYENERNMKLTSVFSSWSKTVGVFWLNAAETWVDIANSAADKVYTTSSLTLPLTCDAPREGYTMSSCFLSRTCWGSCCPTLSQRMRSLRLTHTGCPRAG